MAFPSFYRQISDTVVRELVDALGDGKHVALLGPRQGGKSLLLSELEHVARTGGGGVRPHAVTLTGASFREAEEDGFLATLAAMLELPLNPPAHGARLSGQIADLLKAAVRATSAPLWVLVRDALELPTPIARELLQAFQDCAEDRSLGRRLGVIVTGSTDFIPLTYGELSPYRHAKTLLVFGFDRHHAGLFFAGRRRCQRGLGPLIERGGFDAVDVNAEIDPDALDYLYEQTSGNRYLLQQLVLTAAAYPRPPGLERLRVKWNRADTEAFVEHFLRAHMPHDHFCRRAIREVETDPAAFDLLLKILEEGDWQVTIEGNPHPLEVAGIACRNERRQVAIASPLWRRFLIDALSPRRVADVYAEQHRWEAAWEQYAKLAAPLRDRPISGEASFRLREVLVDWEGSFVDCAPVGSEAVCRQFFRGARYLLGFDAGGIYDLSGATPVVLHSDPDLLSPGELYLPGPRDRPVHHDGPNALYWLDRQRLRLCCRPRHQQSSPLTRTPVLFLQRHGMGREIDSAEQRYIQEALSHFWSAYFRACDIEYAERIGGLRERHLKVIERVNSLLAQQPFDMQRVVQGTADVLVAEAGYYRIMISLVDAKRERIEAVAGCCHDPRMAFNYPSQFPLQSSDPIEDWDIQPWVVVKGMAAVVADASSPPQRNPRTQCKNVARLGMRAIVVVPMKFQDQVLGTIHFERMDKAIPPPEEQALFSLLASQLAVCFHQAQQLTLLQESLMTMADPIRILNPNHHLVFLNAAAAAQHFGASPGWQTPPRLFDGGRDVADWSRLTAEVERSGRPGRRYHFVREGERVSARQSMVAPILDFRAQLPSPFSGANPKIGLVHHVHDVSDLYDLYESLQAWLRVETLDATATQILEFFKRKGFRWCRLYLRKQEASGEEVLVSFQEFGLTERQHRDAFLAGKICFVRGAANPQPWHMISEVRGPAIYEHRSDLASPVELIQESTGFPMYWTAKIEGGEELEKPDESAWIEAPLLMGNSVVGLLSLSLPDELGAEQWELLRAATFGATVALWNAIRAESEARRAADEGWKVTAAQAVHQLQNKILPVSSWLGYAVRDLDRNPPAVRDDIRRAVQGIDAAVHILDDFQEYATDRPFRDLTAVDVGTLLRTAADEIRQRHHEVAAVAVSVVQPARQVKLSLEALIDVFEILVNNSLRHGRLEPEDLRIQLSDEPSPNATGSDHDKLSSVCLRYRDNGAGIPACHQARIFDPFFTTHKDGTGLGLNVARRHVRRLGGEIVLANPGEPGACFEILLPVADEE